MPSSLFHKRLLLFCLLLSLFFTLITPSIARATIYQPGETLEPDCAPGSVGCGVSTSSFTSGLTISGNVGIGTANPSALLQVAGNARAATLQIDDTLYASNVDSPSILSPQSQRGVSKGDAWAGSGTAPTPIREHGQVVYKNKIWIIGGFNLSGASRHVYSSGDGMTWTEAGSNALPLAERGLRALVYQGAMWALGSNTGSGSSNNIYSSTDGITWTLKSVNPISDTDGYGAVVYNGKMWIIGGSKSVTQPVYSSTDGITWTLAGNLPSRIRQHDSVVFDDKMWVIGGFNDSTGSSLRTVYYSSDGATWTQAGSNALPVGLWGLSSVVYNGKMWTLGGRDETGSGHQQTVYSSTDGANWTLAGSNTVLGPITLERASVFNGQMITIGGWCTVCGPGTSSNITSTVPTSAGLIVTNATGSTEFLRVDSTGNVGIGTTTPTAPLEVKGTGTGVTIAKFTDTNTTGCTLATGGTISCSSDLRLKKNITDIDYGLSTLIKLHPVNYNWNYEGDYTTKNLGFIAQEVELIIPKLITTDDTGYKQLNTIGIIPIITKSIQELSHKFDGLAMWLSDQANGITSVYANIFNAKEKICIDGECLTKDDIHKLLQSINSQTSNLTESEPPAPEAGAHEDEEIPVDDTGNIIENPEPTEINQTENLEEAIPAESETLPE